LRRVVAARDDGNDANPGPVAHRKVCSFSSEKTVEVVRNHEDGTRRPIGVGVPKQDIARCVVGVDEQERKSAAGPP